MASDVMQV